ncbi:MAG: 23S rRNA (guanosine(2251)-2'-O)-methyltransferase RlmB [Kiritimatiellae bacterium]|nr:23S rRNA (guanosine(2251)-2'-O)-methyltransferase RlmB [Kiritimatiellia bacterium]
MRKRNKQSRDFSSPRETARSDKADRGDWIYGRRPALEVLRAGKRHIYGAVLPPSGRDAPEVAELRALLLSQGIPFSTLERDELDELCCGGNHQGVALRTGGFPYISFDQVLHDIKERADAIVLILDHIEDPQNVGSLLRTADAAGVTSVLLPEDRAAGITPAATRASAGACEHMRVAKVVNLVRAMKEIQAQGAWITGLDMGPDARPHTSVDFKGRVALVVGSEGRGLSRLVRETCDFIACLPMKGRVASLNAGVAGAIALYEVVRQRGGDTANAPV